MGHRRVTFVGFVIAGVAAASCASSGVPGYDDSSQLPARADGGEDASPDARDGAPTPDDGSAPPVDGSAPRCDLSKPFGAPQPIAELNTSDEDIVSDISPDELTIYVSTNHGGNGVHDFFASRATTSAAFGALQPLYTTTGAYDDWGTTVTSDGLIAVVSSTRSGGVGPSDLYVSTRSSTLASFGAPSLIAGGVNTTNSEEGPRWSADGKTLYFDRTVSGNRDLYRVPVVASTFGAPERISELSAPGLDAAPVISADELTIYFVSDRAGSTDGDIFVATRATKSAPFSGIEKLANVNAAGADAPGAISPDGCVLYMSSTGASGHFDAYVAKRPN